MDANLPMRPHDVQNSPYTKRPSIEESSPRWRSTPSIHAGRSERLGIDASIVLRHLTRFGDGPADVENGPAQISRLFEGKASHDL
jgi:hypothetical protein